jgi:hypothetical protein
MIRRPPVLWTSLGVSLFAIACSSAPRSLGDNEGNGMVTLAQRTTVVDPDVSDVADVRDDRILFPATMYDRLASHRAGDILVGDRADGNERNPDGFLRRVVSITKEGDTTVVMTQPATLQEAADELIFSAKLETPPLDATGPRAQSAGLRTQGTGKPISLIDFSGTKILDVNESVQVDAQHNVGFQMFATVTKGSVGFTPSWDIGADLGFLKVKSFHATATGEIDAALEIDAGVKLTSNLDSDTFTKLVAQKVFKSNSKKIADYNVKLGKLKIGPLPIPVSARFTATLDCDFAMGGGAEVVYGGSAVATVTAGVKYANDTFTPVFAKSLQLTQTGPNWTLDGLTKIKCTVTPKFDLKLLGVASGEIWANGYVDVGGSLTCGGKDAQGNQLAQVNGSAGAGASAGVKAKVDVLGLIKWSKACTLFDVDTHADYQTSFTLPGGPNATCTGTDAYKRDEHTASPNLCFGGDQGQQNGGNGGGNNNNSCAHDECTAGSALGSMCSPCVQKICANDSYCCDTFWGPSCMNQVETVCGFKCQ